MNLNKYKGKMIYWQGANHKVVRVQCSLPIVHGGPILPPVHAGSPYLVTTVHESGHPRTLIQFGTLGALSRCRLEYLERQVKEQEQALNQLVPHQ